MVLGALSTDVGWEHVGRASDLPTFAPVHGVAGVRKFFGVVAKTLDFQRFAPSEFHVSGDLVFAMGNFEATMKKTGKRAASEWLHVFWLKNGKVARFLEFTDTQRSSRKPSAADVLPMDQASHIQVTPAVRAMLWKGGGRA